MDNTSKSASDMIGTGSLKMKYNRGRQAAITNELVDIITVCRYVLYLVFHSYKSSLRCQCLCKLVLQWKTPHRSLARAKSLLNRLTPWRMIF